jgi:FixJ family two-component response regulator
MMDDNAIVYIVDDDTAIREALEGLFRSVSLKTVCFNKPRGFLETPIPSAPACIVLDVRLPEMSGLEFQRELLARDCKIPVIFVTGHGDIEMSVQAMKAGAVEFFTKPFRHQSLLESVQRAIEGDQARLTQERYVSNLRERFEMLTTREREVMSVLVTGQLNKQIGATIGATESTVKAHRTQIMRKMEANSLPELVRMADRLGVVEANMNDM